MAKLRRSSLFTLSKQRKVSDVLLDFVGPALVMAGAAPAESHRELLAIAVLVWNAVLLEDERGADYLSDVRARLQQLDPRGGELMSALVEDLVDRKRNAFADHRWLIGDWALTFGPTGPRLRVEARRLPPPQT